VLQDARTGNGAFFGNMPDQENRDTAGFGQLAQPGGAFAHLGNGSGGGFHFRQGHRLNGINHHQRGLDCLDVRKYHPKVCFRHQEQIPRQGCLAGGIVRGQTHRAHLHLAFRFLTGDVEHDVLFRQLHRHLQGERGLSDARVAAYQHDRTGHNPPAQHPGEFLHAHRHAFFPFAFDFSQAARLGRRIQPAHRAG